MGKLSKEEQVKKIQEIMGRGHTRGIQVPHYRFTFGKYQGDLLESVYAVDRQYLQWLYNNSEKLPRKLEKFIEEYL